MSAVAEYEVIGQTETRRLNPDNVDDVQEGVLVRWKESQYDYVASTFVPRRYYPQRVRDLVMADVLAFRDAHNSGG